VQRVRAGLEVLDAVFADRDDTGSVRPLRSILKAPAAGLDRGDRCFLADPPMRAVGIDAADGADAAVVVEAIASCDAMDQITSGTATHGAIVG